MDPEEIVISGIAGRFPASADVEDFYYKLLAGVDLIDDAETLWEHGPFDMPRRAGKLPYPEKFDAAFFGIPKKQANAMDVRQRVLLETTFEAIFDSGVSPASVRGSRTGVFVGATGAESFSWSVNNYARPDSYNFVGHSTSILANRLSYAFDLKGPSLYIDTACSAGLTCLQRAVLSIRCGECDHAIVAGINILCEPKLTLSIANHGMLSSDGICRAFDTRASGYVRSEAAVSMFLSKRRDAKRIYATVVHSRVNVDGRKEGDMNRPSVVAQAQLLRDTYAESGVDVSEISYLEAHGTGTPVGDPAEIRAVEEVICKGRSTPLLIGSVKSNMGHGEPAAGLCSIVKLVLAHTYGVLPGNIHFIRPGANLGAIQSNKVVIVSRNIPWPGSLVGVSAFGFGGANAHAIIRFGDDDVPHSQISPKLKAPELYPHSDRLKFFEESHLGGVHLDTTRLAAQLNSTAVTGAIFPPFSPSVIWEHSESYKVTLPAAERDRHDGVIYEISLSSEESSFYRHHCLGGRIIFPAAGYLNLVWDTFAAIRGTRPEYLAIKFQDVSFEEAIVLSTEVENAFRVQISQADGTFGVLKDGTLACRGRIEEFSQGSSSKGFYPVQRSSSVPHELGKEEFYAVANSTGFEYTGPFQCVLECDLEGTLATVEWNGNWVTLIDGMLQLHSFDYTKWRPVPVVPTRIQHVVIHPQRLLDSVRNGRLKVVCVKDLRLLDAPGIQIRDIHVSPSVLINAKREVGFARHVFTPYSTSCQAYNEDEIIQICIQIVLLNGSVDSAMRVFNNLSDTADGGGSSRNAFVLGKKVTFIKHNQLNERDKNMDTSPKFELAIVDSLECDANAWEGSQYVLWKATTASCISIPPSNWQQIAKYITRSHGYTLLRSRRPLEKIFRVVRADPHDYKWVHLLKEALESGSVDEDAILLYYDGPSPSGLLGLMSSLLREPDSGRVRCFLDLDGGGLWNFGSPSADLGGQLDLGLKFNVLCGCQWGFYCSFSIDGTTPKSLQPSRSCRVAVTYGSGKSSLRIEARSPFDSPSQQDKLLVNYVGLNFKDAMIVAGKYLPVDSSETDYHLGLEFSGSTVGGERVFGFSIGCLGADSVPHDASITFPVPPAWSPAEAASVPVCWGTAIFALHIKARLRPGDSVLIHAGAGGVGIACIRIALALDCTVYTTVGSVEKRRFLLKLFPKLGEQHVFYSRNYEDFEEGVMTATRGQGVDVVVNSLSGSSLFASLRCVKTGGRFVELGKADLLKNSKLGLLAMSKGMDLFFCDLFEVMTSQSTLRDEFLVLFREKISSGEVTPLPLKVYDMDALETALEELGTGVTVGKVVVRFLAENVTGVPRQMLAIPKVYFNPAKVYVLIGGLGGMGLEIVKWMVDRGMRKVVLVSRSGIRTSYQRLVHKSLQERCSIAEVWKDDLSTVEAAVKFFKNIHKNCGVVDGIFNLAAVLKDGLFVNQTPHTFGTVCEAKFELTAAMDRASRELGLELRFFTVFSSITSSFGNAGQTNYGYANSGMERIIERRRRDGLPGMAIQWGAVYNVGLMSKSVVKVDGLGQQSMMACLQALDYLLLQDRYPVISCYTDPDVDPDVELKHSDKMLETFLRIFGKRSLLPSEAGKSFDDIGMDSLMAAEIKIQLRKHNLEDIQSRPLGSLTFADIKASADKRGSLATQPEMPPLLDPSQTDTSWFVDFDVSNVPRAPLELLQERPVPVNLFLVHTLDGTSKYLQSVARGIDANVWAFQCTSAAPLSTVEDLASYYIEQMQRVQPAGPYFIGGYSYGGLVATEIALQLERIHTERQIVCLLLDGSPDKIKRMLESTVFTSGRGVDIASIFSGCKMYGIPSTAQVEESIMSGTEPRMIVKAVAASVPATNDKIRSNVEMTLFRFHRLFKMATEYTPIGYLQACAVILLKSTRNNFKTDSTISSNYNLEQIAANIIHYDIDGDHNCFYESPEELDVQTIINRALSNAITRWRLSDISGGG